MGGSIVDNLHGWITCGQCPRVDHVWKISTGGPHVDMLVTGGAHVDGRDFP